MAFFNLFKKKDKSKGQPIDGLSRYLSALENGDRDQLLRAVVPDVGDESHGHVMADFFLEIHAVFSGVRDIFGRDIADVVGLKNFPFHKSDDARTAEFRRDGNVCLAKMKDGHMYALVKAGGVWRVQWPDLTINAVTVDADMAKALTAAFAKAHASLGKDLVSTQDIQSELEASLQNALAPYAQQMPKTYNTFPLHDLANIQPQTVDPSLRSDLEAAYEKFRKAVVQKDHEALFAATRIKTSELNILEKKVSAGGFEDFADWIAMMNPPLAETAFVTIKLDGDDFAAYYFTWTPAYSSEVQNLSVRQFEKTMDGWTMLYTFEASDVPLSVASDEDLTAKILEEVESNPIIKMKRPVRKTAGKTTERYNARLKAELDTVYDAYQQALSVGDLQAFFTTTRSSLSDEEQLRSAYRKRFPEILAFYPPRSETTFVTLRRQDAELAGYYHIVPEPSAPEFENVLLVPFVRHAGKWKILFSLDMVPRINLLAAKGEGDRISRAFELIDLTGTLLNLEYITSIFEDSLLPDSHRDLLCAATAIDTGEYETALELLQPLAEKGSARAKTALGLLHAKGNGVQKDGHKAFHLFTEASCQGDSDAFYHLGYAYFNGEGVGADQTQALACLMAADRLGHEKAGREVESARAALQESVIEEAKASSSKLISGIENGSI